MSKKISPCELNQPRLAKTIAYYDPLLRRYARRFVHNDGIAAGIVLQVIEHQYELNGLVAAKHLRQVLKTDVLNRCYYWKQSQIFKQNPAKVRELNETRTNRREVN